MFNIKLYTFCVLYEIREHNFNTFCENIDKYVKNLRHFLFIFKLKHILPDEWEKRLRNV